MVFLVVSGWPTIYSNKTQRGAQPCSAMVDIIAVPLKQNVFLQFRF